MTIHRFAAWHRQLFSKRNLSLSVRSVQVDRTGIVRDTQRLLRLILCFYAPTLPNRPTKSQPVSRRITESLRGIKSGIHIHTMDISN